MLSSHEVIDAACVFSILGCALALYQILCHLCNYTEPVFQRYIIRIIFMVPVYAIGSLCSLRFRDHSIYSDTLRDCYEAWIIYNFSSLLLAYVGGPGAVVVKAEGKQVHPSWAHMTCCLPTMQVDGFFLRRCKQGTLQFVLLKPIMALLTVILYASGAYTEGDMSPDNGYFYISIVYNISYTFALYGLLLFWIGASELLQPFNPLLKFVLVKAVVFLTFWQGIGISYINSMGEFTDPEEGEALQNFMICVEMALAGTGLLFAFPHKEYQIGGSTAGFRLDAFLHAVSIRDVVADTIHVFAPSYSDYVLYTDGGPADNVKRKKYRGQKGAVSEHPKAGLLKNMDKGVLANEGDDPLGRRSKTPNGSNIRKMEAHRKQAILLDSDSDGIDSDDGGGAQLGTEITTGSDDDEVYHRYTATAMTDTRGSVSDGEEQPAEQPSSNSNSRRTSRKFHRMNSKSSRRSLEVVNAMKESAISENEAVGVVSSNEGSERRRHWGTRNSGIGALGPSASPLTASKPLTATIIITAAQIQLLLGGPILPDDDSAAGLVPQASVHGKGLDPAAAAADTSDAGVQHPPSSAHVSSHDASTADMCSSAVTSASAIMQHVSIKAFEAAGKFLGAAQGTAGLSGGGTMSHGNNYTSVVSSLDPPATSSDQKPAAGSMHNTSNNGKAAAAHWEPAFPAQQAKESYGQQRPRERQHEQPGQVALKKERPGAKWAEEGWLAVQL